jgi:hypothetical protein
MSDIAGQVHDKFKVFAGTPDEGRSLGSIAEEVAAFAASSKIAAKSIGVEYLESARRLIVTLGYREGGEAYPIKLSSVSLGKTANLRERTDFAELEQAIGAATAGLDNIICHELFITEADEIVMVFMQHGA